MQNPPKSKHTSITQISDISGKIRFLKIFKMNHLMKLKMKQYVIMLYKWYILFNKILTIHAPLKTKSIKQLFKPCWLTHEITEAQHHRD